MHELIPSKTDTVLRHDRQLWQARYTPCGRYLIATGYDATIQRWDVSGEQPQLMQPLTGHDGWVQCMAFHPTEKRIYSADSWGRLACWDYTLDSNEPLWTKPDAHDGWIRTLAINRAGTLLATGGNGTMVRLWSPSDGNLLREIPHPQRVYSLAFHPDGKSLVSGDLEGTIRHWNLETWTESRKFDASLLFSHDVAEERIQHCGGVRLLAFNDTGTQLACGGQKEPQGGFAKGTPCILVHDWDSGELIREMPMGGTEDGFAYDVQFHPDGFIMAASSAFPGKGHVWFWKPEDEAAFFSNNKLSNGRSLSVHPDGRRVAFLSSNSRNGNGRALKDGQYEGGFAEIRLLAFTEGDPPASENP